MATGYDRFPIAMKIVQAYQTFIERIARAAAIPGVREILLPLTAPIPGETDDFGFVVLEDGSVGPFYVSLADTYQGVAATIAANHGKPWDTVSLARQIGCGRLAEAALALGAFNALSQHLMRRAGFDPVAEGSIKSPLGDGIRIGLVGYFRPLVERLLKQGHAVTVIEKQPQRVPVGQGVTLVTSPEALADCDRVLCTASVLINATVDSIVDACAGRVPLELIGPSASGLPDPLFQRGVAAVGGILIEDGVRLKQALSDGESWGTVGQKYQLDPTSWPGADALLRAIQRR